MSTPFFYSYKFIKSRMFDHNLIQRIQQANDIVEIISEHVSLHKKGKELVSLCPFHDDHSPSMYVSPVKQIFKCFACGAGGDVFKFVQMRENLSFTQAVERLGERAGIEVKNNFSRNKASKREQGDDVDPNRIAGANKWAKDLFVENLQNAEVGKAAREYTAQRQINQESIDKWMIGLASVDNDLVGRAIEQKGPLDILKKAGLVTAGQTDKFVNRLMFPIADVSGRIIGFGGRTLDGSGAKYINSPATVLFDKSNSVYGLFQARHEIVKQDVVVVVEGYTDCIMAHQAGCCNVVATLGTSFTEGHVRQLKRFARKIVLLFDSDLAGQKAADRAVDICLNQRVDIKVASIGEGKDPCDFIVARGREGFLQLMADAEDAFEFKWKRLKESMAKDDTVSAKSEAIENYLSSAAKAVASGNVSAIEKGVIVNKLAGVVGLGAGELNSELNRLLGRLKKSESYAVKNSFVRKDESFEGLAKSSQREIVEVLLNEPSLISVVESKLSLQDFDVESFRIIMEKILQLSEQNGDIDVSQILSRIESIEMGSLVVDLADKGCRKGNYSARLNAAVEVLADIRAASRDQGLSGAKTEDVLRSFSKKKSDRRNIGLV